MKKSFLLLLFILCMPAILFSQNTKRDSLWMPLKPFLGEWIGDGEGEPGKGKYERSYQLIFNKRFIEVHNKSTYPPKTENTQGEIHEDVGYMSYDKSRKTFALRQFHTEGFVNEYVLESISTDGKTISFVTESIENLPAGFRARETYQLLNENEFEETFEIAEPGKDFALYTRVKFIRQK
ncbi:MAG: FABP family protein [Ignavibacteria bacterium]|nr:FABP family protein [Ignavibacteria bacterium]